jgi:hypothetical protein
MWRHYGQYLTSLDVGEQYRDDVFAYIEREDSPRPLSCLHDTLTLDPDGALLGRCYPNEQDAAFVARTFRPLAQDRMDDLRSWPVRARREECPCW